MKGGATILDANASTVDSQPSVILPPDELSFLDNNCKF